MMTNKADPLLKLTPFMLVLFFVIGCSMAAKDLKTEVGAIRVQHSMPSEDAAIMVSNGISGCGWGEPSMRKTGKNSWMVSHVLAHSSDFGPALVVEVTDKKALVAPRLSHGIQPLRASIIAEWLENGKAERCDSYSDYDGKRWSTLARKYGTDW